MQLDLFEKIRTQGGTLVTHGTESSASATRRRAKQKIQKTRPQKEALVTHGTESSTPVTQRRAKQRNQKKKPKVSQGNTLFDLSPFEQKTKINQKDYDWIEKTLYKDHPKQKGVDKKTIQYAENKLSEIMFALRKEIPEMDEMEAELNSDSDTE